MSENKRNIGEEKVGSVDSSINIDKLLSNLKVPAGKGKEVIWQSILEGIEHQRPAKVLVIPPMLIRIAASIIVVALISGVVLTWRINSIDLYSPKGQHLLALLPDGSTVKLNADTRISYNKLLWRFSREVRIEGEGLFKVKKGEKFDVIADNTTTSVLGTTFNVYYREGKIEVSCIEGKVSVESKITKEKVLLKGGYKTEIKKSAMVKPVEIKETVEVKWSNGDFYFNNTPIKEVFEELERQFDVDLFYEGDPDRFYTGYFSNKDLKIALGLVCIPMDLNYVIKGKVVIIQNNVYR